MRYIPHTGDDVRRMLAAVGASSLDDLHESVPDAIRLKGALHLPEALGEARLLDHLERLADSNDGARMVSFLGGGAYRHHIPPAVDQLLLRGEFFTAYTPYQAELSQGNLQAIFEFQTMIARLLGMEVANASMYDGASASAEAVLMAMRATRRETVVLSSGINPAHRGVIDTITQYLGDGKTTLPLGTDGRTDYTALDASIGEAAAVVVQSPNFAGVFEDLPAARKLADRLGAKLVVTFTEPLAYAIAEPPGAFGADIVAGEGQSFGVPASFGGPYLGLFAAKKDDVRQMPGRLCGETVDGDGKRAFVLTLSTREQHIRREKATSNICTNQALCALACTIYLTLHGKNGLPILARQNLATANAAREALENAGAKRKYAAAHFNEFVVTLPMPAEVFLTACRAKGIIGGLPLGGTRGFGENDLLVCATELNTDEDAKRLAAVLSEATHAY
ncbi:aminomethyl-transferring glycine dehydrogenase subunit GcvPA [bacterium]|nr:aminomethyl-transferring glycine dehydrogenase subunit GcvPA [bacterium]